MEVLEAAGVLYEASHTSAKVRRWGKWDVYKIIKLIYDYFEENPGKKEVNISTLAEEKFNNKGLSENLKTFLTKNKGILKLHKINLEDSELSLEGDFKKGLKKGGEQTNPEGEYLEANRET